MSKQQWGGQKDDMGTITYRTSRKEEILNEALDLLKLLPVDKEIYIPTEVKKLNKTVSLTHTHSQFIYLAPNIILVYNI